MIFGPRISKTKTSKAIGLLPHRICFRCVLISSDKIVSHQKCGTGLTNMFFLDNPVQNLYDISKIHQRLMPVNKLSNLFKSFSNLSLYVGYDDKCLCISLRILGNVIRLI